MQALEPWDYQKKAVQMVWAHLAQNAKVLVVSPGGSGKTVMIAQQAAEAVQRGAERVLIISHRKEIIEQTQLTLLKLGLKSSDIGVLMGSVRENLGARVVVASMMSLIRWKLPLHATDVIVDEAHHVLATGYSKVLDRYPTARHTGYTATPFRMDGRGLGDFYTAMIVAALPSALIERNKLAQPIIYRAPDDFMPRLADLKVARGDYVSDALNERVNSRALVGNIVENYKKHADGKRAIAFAVSIEHSERIVSNFLEAGIAAAHVDGTMPAEKREQLLASFREGKIQVVSNCMVLSEGYDLPACDAVIMARPTQSLTLYIQQAARGMRYLPGKHPVLLDHGRLLEQFGLPEADRHYVLTKTKENLSQWSAGPVKDCPQCGACVSAATRFCPNCSHEFPTIARGIPMESDTALSPFDEAARVALEQRVYAEHGDTKWSREILAL